MTASLPRAPRLPSFAKTRLPSPPAPFSASHPVRLPQTVGVSQPRPNTEVLIASESSPQPFAGAIAEPVPTPEVEAELIPQAAAIAPPAERSSGSVTRTIAPSSQRLPVPPAPPAASKPALPTPPALPSFAAIALPTAPKPALGTSEIANISTNEPVGTGAPSATAELLQTKVEAASDLNADAERVEAVESVSPSELAGAVGAGVVGAGAIAAVQSMSSETSEPQTAEVTPEPEALGEVESAESRAEEPVAIATELPAPETSDEAATNAPEAGVAAESEAAPEPTPASSGAVDSATIAPKTIASQSDDDEDRLTGEEIAAVIFALVFFSAIIAWFFFDDTLGFGSGRRLEDLPRPELVD